MSGIWQLDRFNEVRKLGVSPRDDLIKERGLRGHQIVYISSGYAHIVWDDLIITFSHLGILARGIPPLNCLHAEW